jgi:hypothetical protein
MTPSKKTPSKKRPRARPRRTPRRGRPAPTDVLIVLRDVDPELLALLRREFRESAVIVDRRVAERRQAAGPASEERRRLTRRDLPVRWSAIGLAARPGTDDRA